MASEPRRRGVVRQLAPLVLCLPLLAAVAHGQTGDGFDLTWNTVDAGGGTSAGSGFSVDGTAGQIDATTLSDGTYTLSGGFWAGVSSGPSGACVGDCNGDGSVTVDELVIGVNIALSTLPLTRCPSFDSNGDSQVTVDELIKGVNNALGSCA